MKFVNNIKNEFIRIKNEVNNNEILIDGEIGESLFTEGYSFSTFKDDLSQVEGDVVINIKSYGGDLFEALAVYDYIKAMKNKVTTRIVGATASAGTVIAFAGDERLISANSRYLIHKPMVGAMGNSDDFKKVLSMLESLDAQLVSLYAEKSKLSNEEILALMIREEFITAQKALEYGFVDGIIEDKSQTKFTNKSEKKMEKVLTALKVDSEDKALNAITEMQASLQALKVKNEETEEEMGDKDKEIEDLKAKIATLEEQLKEKEVENAEEEMEEIEDAITNAIKAGKITNENKSDWEDIGLEKGSKYLNKMLASIPEPKKGKLSNIIIEGDGFKTKDELNAAFKANKITAGEYAKQLKKF
jgi:ATP-dependent Clp protease, protease subunit